MIWLLVLVCWALISIPAMIFVGNVCALGESEEEWIRKSLRA